jgi:hypothetical protein
MAVGKNKLARFTRLYYGGYDLSGDQRKFDVLVNEFDSVDMTGEKEAVENFLSNKRRKVGVTGYQALLNDAAGGASAVLKSAPNTGIVSVYLGGGGAPAAGDMAYLLPAVQLADTTEFNEGKGIFSTDFKPDAAQMSSLVDTPIGVVLMPKAALTETTTGSTVDNLVGTTAGGRANLHVFVSSGGTWAFTVEHKTDVGVWATLLTFVVTGNSVTAEQKTASGTVNRNLRFVATRTSGTCTIACGFARN